MFYDNGTYETPSCHYMQISETNTVKLRKWPQRQSYRECYILTKNADIKVCRQMFFKTLSTDSAFMKANDGSLQDKRRRHALHNKIPEEPYKFFSILQKPLLYEG